MKPQLTHFPTSRRTAYQFPIYRWMGWLAVGGFAIGLTAMFFISGMFGVPAPLGWATLVILFSLGALLLDRPKLLLNCMLIYFLMMPGNRLFGILALPLPSFLDELFFIPFIAVIVMNWIQRRQVQGGGWFPLIFGLIATLSWFVNGRLSPFTFVRATLIMLKPFIIWYYCRLTATFESEAPIRRWLWFAFIFAAIQFPYNCIWQGAPLAENPCGLQRRHVWSRGGWAFDWLFKYVRPHPHGGLVGGRRPSFEAKNKRLGVVFTASH